MDDSISKLSEIRSDYNCFSADEEPYYRALSEAIKILSQRADGDAISRKAAIDCATYDVGHTIECLKALPSVQPETAKRIVGKSRDGMTLWYQCDMCNEPVNLEDSFCSGCGRRLTDG